ncbi:T cell activation RhoGTPase activating protein b [Pholidichthys leucotaenia]
MKVLSGNIAIKTLTGGGMEQLIDFQHNGDTKTSALSKQLHNQEDRPTQPIETKWNVVRRLRNGSSFLRKAGRTETDTKTQLFGQPLCKICPDEGSLPKPVTELLVWLRKRGPSTEGVFRKQCSSKVMKELRDQLNNGVEVDLESQPVVLLVGLLKSFLKELPGSLLVSELYDKWMTALDNEDDKQRAQEISKVVDDLPGPNKLLLQHLFCVLHHILEGADITKMDAYNLAVCIGPTLLQLGGTPEEQSEKMKKARDLTKFLIENYEILGENIPGLLDTDEDSVSSQHQDSAYDSTDPDGDGEAGESSQSTRRDCSSSSSTSSLSPSTATSCWPSDGIFSMKPMFDRRCSEPSIFLSADLRSLPSHSRSHDDCSVVRRVFSEQPLKKPISDDSFLLRGQGEAKLILPFPNLEGSSNVDPQPYIGKDCSCSSLDSTASNQSEGSVFTNSPTGSPGCSRKEHASIQPSATTKLQQNISKPDERKRSQSLRATTKVLLRTRSLGAFSRSSQKRDSLKENSFPCETLQEDSQSEADPPADFHRPRPLSAIEVFKHVDSRLPCSPPSYEHAVHNMGPPPEYRSMTVRDALEVERRSRPSSVNYDFPSTQYTYNRDCFAPEANVVERRQPFRQRAMSESVSARQHDVVSRRCSQPVFEEFSYSKESYV